ncbi:major facilitator superfamily domain-containing protein 8-like [Lineus longissimus]|uniref:major facilitator superfamily domain-containing protein 8-like n=1 Tax=Lineus longissimus TaxID=88925 RepID=UPI002B4CC7F3
MDSDDILEKTSLLRPVPPLQGSTNLTSGSYGGSTNGSVGVPSTVVEPPNVYRSRWNSIRVMYLTMFLSSVSFTLCAASIWPYLLQMDRTANASFLGWVIASYSLGQLVSSIFFGSLANALKRSTLPLILTLILNVAGYALYAYIEDISSDRKYYLIVSRILLGMSAGNVAVVRSYIAAATTLKERTGAFANASAAQALGFIIGPALQAAFSPIGYPGVVDLPGLHLNLYTTPAWLGLLLSIFNIFAVACYFTEHKVYDDETSARHDKNIQGPLVSHRLGHEERRPDYVAVVANIFIFFCILVVFTMFETIGTPFAMDMFTWTREQATLYCGIILAAGAVLSFIVFIFLKEITKRIPERVMMLLGFLIILIGFFIYLPWGNKFPNFQYVVIGPSMHNSTTPVPGNLTTSMDLTTSALNFTTSVQTSSSVNYTSSNASTYTPQMTTPMDLLLSPSSNSSVLPPVNHTAEPAGCDPSHKWCLYTPMTYLAQFLAASALVSIGYPICFVIANTLFSKILGPRPQGFMMGVLTASGSLARTVGPIYVGWAYNTYGVRVAYGSAAGVVIAAAMVFTIFYKRLVPFGSPVRPSCCRGEE